MNFYVYRYELDKEYGFMNGTHFHETWTKITECGSFSEAMDVCRQKAEEDKYEGERVPYEQQTWVGCWYHNEALGGVTIRVNPLPYVEVGYYIFYEDVGNDSIYFSGDELEQKEE